MLLTRREMLELSLKAGLGGLAGAALSGAAPFFISEADAAEGAPSREALFYEPLSNGDVRCTLCPRKVILSPGKTCYCKTRRNLGGKLIASGFDKPCIVNVDDIERNPLYHYLPGSKTLAMGAAGCNMDCLYCQNYELAQSPPEKVKTLNFAPSKGIAESKAQSLTLTYTDAICQPEYLFSLSEIARKQRAKVILCSGAYVNPEPLDAFIKHVDAFAITLKAFDDDSYMRLTGIHLNPVLDALVKIKASGKWLEVVTLIVPDYNDDAKGIQSLAKWIRSNLGETTPWHLSKFVPEYKLKKLPPTPRRTLEDARKAGQDAGLKYVYITNLAPHEGNNSYCPSCGNTILERLGFKLKANHLQNGKCPNCGTAIQGVWS